MLYASISAFVTGLLCYAVFVQYFRRGRPYQLAWAISLAMAAIASSAYALSVAVGGSPYLFRLYYWFGGQLMAAAMGIGSLFLGASPRVARLFLWVMSVVATVGTYYLWTAPLDQDALAALAAGSGRGILLLSPVGRVSTVILNVFGTIAVVAIAIISGIRFARRQASGSSALGNWLIAGGTLTIGAAGSAAGVGSDQLFWPVMTLGWLIFFAGFVLVNRLRERLRN